ncbi:hypothetical protein [Peribacillus sp. FSL E2-0159]|uniref:hypothetical protein n=1 Tax=Peribacillus sp. FSL E2-0159 TaxID=2975289 RepID=UPI003159FFC2
MANKRFTKQELTRSAASAKRTFIRKAKNGIYIDRKITKGEAIEKIASLLHVTTKSLYNIKERKDYLDEWYNKLLNEVHEINQEIMTEKNITSLETLRNLTIEQLLEELKIRDQKLKVYRTKVLNQEILIEKLMKKVITRYDKIEPI